MPPARNQKFRTVTLRVAEPVGAALTTSAEAAQVIFARIEKQGSWDRENFVAVALNVRNQPIGVELLFIGTATEAVVSPREVFRWALGVGAVHLVVGHNHPSGDIGPSKMDEELTQRLKEAGELLGIRVLDSIVLDQTGRFQVVPL